ncbi:iron transport multicopper oxidase FET3 [Coniochaeta sp. 2T2.1]|nr:iron transport multicopper oxidase FET3 [Coniochaeta sp. 2T2.1]
MRPSGVLSVTVLSLASLANAGTITYNWDVTWVNAAPDGFSRPVIGINNQWPCPKIEATKGDTVIVNLINKLGNETTGLHFHGINQINTMEMDGPSAFTQCPVPPGSSIQYKFLVDAAGTYWYHSHNMGQYPDGLRGPLIVHDPADPYAGKYDEEVILTVSDWYHSETIPLMQTMLSPANGFRPPFPDGIIVNEGGDGQISFVKGKTYRIRIISFAAFASAFVHFDSHTMSVIMNDGSYIKNNSAYQLRIAPAQRYDVLVSAIDRDRRNYPYLVALDINKDFANDASVSWPHNFTGQLVMDKNQNFTTDVVNAFRPQDDSNFAPYDGAAAFGPVTKTLTMNFEFCTDQNGIGRACINGSPNIPQKVPTLYTAATTGNDNTNPIIYGAVNPFIVSANDIVDIVINNRDDAIHPFHLHGHQFQVLDRPRSGTGDYPGRTNGLSKNPPMRDVISVNGRSYAVLRFKADNPGVFLFHCHIEWHVEMGLTATIIEGPELLRGKTFPADHLNNCKLMKIPTEGNAAGNTVNHTDTTGFITVPDPNYIG